MIKPLLNAFGWTIAHTPLPLLQGFSDGLGWLMLHAMPRRRHLVYSNLHHAFPEKDRAWHKRMASESSSRLFETALLSLAFPFLPDERLKRMIRMPDEVRAIFEGHTADKKPKVIATFHMAHWEAMTTIQLFINGPLPEIGVVFRPLNNPTANAFVKEARERHGMKLLSRKEGLQEAFRILRRHGFVALLVDQNAGDQGTLTTLLGRVCSTSDLAGILTSRYGADVAAVWPYRRGFWEMEFRGTSVPTDGTSASTTVGLNQALEKAIKADDNACASWLWSHGRWRNQEAVQRRFRIDARQSFLAEDIQARGWTSLPKSTRIWVRLPNWLGDVVMALPLLRALKASRPDAEITLIGKGAFVPLIEVSGVADRIISLPKRGRGYFRFFRELRHQFPDTYLLLTNSARGDLEARLTGCRQRFGMVRPGKWRPLLTHRFHVPKDYVEKDHHQVDLWRKLFEHFGLKLPPDFSRLGTPPEGLPKGIRIGLIAGSENTPAKRWPVEHWRSFATLLLEKFPEAKVLLYGTVKDREITDQIAVGFDPARVENVAGTTDLRAYLAELQTLTLLVGNDTGGMHLGSALGVPLIALFGPTNPVNSGPAFAGKAAVLLPPGCPPTGGGDLKELTPRQVFEEAVKLLS